MNKISQEQYEFALARVEELLPLVNDDTPANDKYAIIWCYRCKSLDLYW